MGKRREKLSGLLLRGPYMAFNHQKPTTFSVKRTVTGSFQRSQNKPSGGLRLQGKHHVYSIHSGKMQLCHLNTEIVSCLPVMPMHFVMQKLLIEILRQFVSCCRCRLRELHTLKGHVESVVKLKGLDIDTIQQHYTVWGRAFLKGNKEAGLSFYLEWEAKNERRRWWWSSLVITLCLRLG